MNEDSEKHSLATLCLAVIAVATVTFMVYWLRPVLVPFVVALFVVSGITPVLETVERFLKVNRLIASVIAFVCGLFLLILLSFCLWGSLQQLALQGQAYRTRVVELLGTAQKWLPSGILPVQRPTNTDSQIEADTESEKTASPVQTGNGASEDRADVDDGEETAGDLALLKGQGNADNLPDDITSEDVSSFRGVIDRAIRQGVTHVSASLLEVFSTSIVVLIYVFFLLLGSADSSKMNGSIQAVNQQVQSYLFLKTVISAVTGAAFGGALWLFGVPMSLTFGLLAFLLNFIPNIGPVVASILPIPFILLSPEGSAIWMVSAIAITMAIQVISGSVVEPQMMGETSDMHPVVILLALMFWGMMWGITGMFLATPITAGIKIVLEGNPTTKPIADILAGRFEKLTGTSEEMVSEEMV